MGLHSQIVAAGPVRPRDAMAAHAPSPNDAVRAGGQQVRIQSARQQALIMGVTLAIVWPVGLLVGWQAGYRPVVTSVVVVGAGTLVAVAAAVIWRRQAARARAEGTYPFTRLKPKE